MKKKKQQITQYKNIYRLETKGKNYNQLIFDKGANDIL